MTLPASSPPPGEDEPVKCKHCKTIVRTNTLMHVKQCLAKAKAEKAKERKKAKEAEKAAAEREKEKKANGTPGPDIDGDTIEVKPLRASKTPGIANATKEPSASPDSKKKKAPAKKATKTDATKSKKRKAEEPSEAKEKKKPKKEKAPKPAPKPKLKEPVDVETKCGVPLPGGGFCARSLTCKSHPMGAKRAVPGRSQPYDVLLAQHQKKNQAKIQKAQMAADRPAPDEGNSAVDSDEETEQVMAAIARCKPRPAATAPAMPVRYAYALQHVQDLFRNALQQSLAAGMQDRAVGISPLGDSMDGVEATGSGMVDGTPGGTPSAGGGGSGASGNQSPVLNNGLQTTVVGGITSLAPGARPVGRPVKGGGGIRRSSLSQQVSQG